MRGRTCPAPTCGCCESGRLDPGRPRRVRPRVVLGDARAHPGRRGDALLRGPPRAQARRAGCWSPCPTTAACRPRHRAHALRGALRPARPARALLHAPLAREHARRRGLRAAESAATARCSSRARALPARPLSPAAREAMTTSDVLRGDRGSRKNAAWKALQRALGVAERRAASCAEPAPGLRVGRLEVDRLLERARAASSLPARLLDRGELEQRVDRQRVAVVGDLRRSTRPAPAGPRSRRSARRPARAARAPAAARSRRRRARSASTSAAGHGARTGGERSRAGRRLGRSRSRSVAREATQPAHSSAGSTLPGTNHVQSIAECSAEDDRDGGQRRQPDALGVPAQARDPAGAAPTVRGRGHEPRDRASSESPSPTQPRSASVCTT